MTLYIDALYMKSQQATLFSLKCITSLMIFWVVYSPSVGNTHHTQLFSLNYYCSHHFENYHKFLKNTAELTYNNWKLESFKKNWFKFYSAQMFIIVHQGRVFTTYL
uniref:Uncharacterized protein n=1 Tax=Micrurus surinamensis TaxID=129470 RepID=A0A2D4PDU2_MICSU